MAADRETLREQAFHLFGRAIARSDPGHLEAWVELGLTLTQLRVLFQLRAEDGASAGTLAERLKVMPSTLTLCTGKESSSSLLSRQPSTASGRSADQRTSHPSSASVSRCRSASASLTSAMV